MTYLLQTHSPPRRRWLARALALAASGSGLARAATDPGTLRWQLTDPQVLDAGRPHTLPEGQFHEGFQMLALATATGTAPLLDQARFRLSGQAFLATGGSGPALWQLRGQWTLSPVDIEADPAGSARHLPGVLRGQFSARCEANPYTHSVGWHAELRMPAGRYAPVGAPQAVQPVRGDGQLVLAAGLDGELSLNLRSPWRGDPH